MDLSVVGQRANGEFSVGEFPPHLVAYFLQVAGGVSTEEPEVHGKMGTSPMQVAMPSNQEHNEGGVMGSFIGFASAKFNSSSWGSKEAR
jgi:hypothetical protein